jgi:hypothetical protein
MISRVNPNMDLTGVEYHFATGLTVPAVRRQGHERNLLKH